jgi:hypothetical protein
MRLDQKPPMKTIMLKRGNEFTKPKIAKIVEVDYVNELYLAEWQEDEKQDLIFRR